MQQYDKTRTLPTTRHHLWVLSHVLTLLALVVMTTRTWASELPEFSQLVEQYRPAVVNISITQQTPAALSRTPAFPDDGSVPEFFRRFFEGRPGPSMPENPAHRRGHAIGSGFIISSDGYLLTNAHVIRDAKEILVSLSDRSELPATVVGMDKQTDIALLKIDATDLPTVKLGDSDDLKVGQWVLAIGRPFGFDYTATQGIISALSRSLPDETYVPFIQTDVAVNPGNSGGPLFDMEGSVIGVNSQIYSRTGGYMGLSFAIPINLAMDVANQLKDNGSVSRGYLGVTIQNLNKELAQSFDLDKPEGALVSSVKPDSPAGKAGIQSGDVILSYNGQTVESSSALPPLVGRTPIGAEAEVKIRRNGKTKTVKVTVGKLEETRTAATFPVNNDKSARLGLVVEELNAEQRKKIGTDKRGVIVRQLDPAGPAAAAGVRAQDIVLSFAHRDVTSAEQLAQLVKEVPTGKPIPLLVMRGDNTHFTSVTIPKQTG